MRARILLAAALIQMAACHSAKTAAPAEATKAEAAVKPLFGAGPHVLVYKTRTNLSDKVPIMLSADGSSVVSWPAPSDLKGPDSLPLPTTLHKGYLLDNRGIGEHTAFIRLTYAEYAAMPEAPDPEALLSMVIDKAPLTELCDCGVKNAFTDVNGQLDRLIDDGQLRKVCKVIK